MTEISEAALLLRETLIDDAWKDTGSSRYTATELALGRLIQQISDSAKVACEMGGITPVYQTILYAHFKRFILPDTADPLLVEARELLVDDHRHRGVDLFFEGTLLKHGAATKHIRDGSFDNRREIGRYIAALKRGIELAGEKA